MGCLVVVRKFIWSDGTSRIRTVSGLCGRPRQVCVWCLGRIAAAPRRPSTPYNTVVGMLSVVGGKDDVAESKRQKKGGRVPSVDMQDIFFCSKLSVVKHRAHLLICCVDVDGKGVQCYMCRKSCRVPKVVATLCACSED